VTTAAPVAVLQNLSKRYGDADRVVWAVRDVSLSIGAREFVSITGPSGSGKSTLLNLVAGLDVPTGGEVIVDGQSVAQRSARQMALFRRKTVAMIFQFFNLLPTLTALENVAVPLRADGMKRTEVNARVQRSLEAVGLSDRAGHYPGQLSGGEMQRVAIARALATDARLILADEPTGNLDTSRGEQILELLRRATDENGRSVLLVTHDMIAASYGDRLLTLRDGRIVDEVITPSAQGKVIPLVRG
jgi:putative ABC transport system ATP-binding protein